MSRSPERRIPRQYQQPRPTVVPERRRVLWSRVPTVWRLLIVGVLVCLGSPLGRLDDLMAVNLLARVASTTPSSAALRITLNGDSLSDCAERWGSRLKAAGVKAVVVAEPLDLVCPIRGAHVLQRSDARRDWIGRVGGWSRIPAIDGPETRRAWWVRPYAAKALPTLDGQSIDQAHLDTSVLDARVVILTYAGGGAADERFEQSILTFAAALSPRHERRAVPTPLVAALAAGWGLLWLRTSTKRGRHWGVLVILVGFSAMVFVTAGLAVLFTVSILPLVTLPAALAAMIATKAIPNALAERRTLRRTNQMVERAALQRLKGLDQIEDAEFYARIAGLAEQWHPANIVLVAQLPTKKWHLVFWHNGSAGENLVAERRRDIRRTPYCDEQGLPTIRIVRDYLAVKEMPVLVVPLLALGEIEGYVFLCGDRAESAFRSDPTIAHRMSLELAMLMRRRRLGRASLDELDDAHSESTRARAIAAGVQTVAEEMDLLGAMVRDAPLGLLLADAFGNVRMVGKQFAHWLAAFGVALPPLHDETTLAPGSLTLLTVLQKLTQSSAEEAQRRLAELATSTNGLNLELRPTESAGVERLQLRCRALRKHALSVDHVAGFVAVLSEEEGEQRVLPTNVVPIAAADELGAFRLADVLDEVTATVNRTARRRAIFEPTASIAQSIGKRTKLAQALRVFLVDAAQHQSPVMVLREKSRELEVLIHDLDLGVPMGAIERAMNAPNHPPPGLEALGRLILAVEESHGTMRMADGRGWGMRLVVRLHRARSVVIAGNSRYPTAIAVAEGLTRSSMSPPTNSRSRRPPSGGSS